MERDPVMNPLGNPAKRWEGDFLSIFPRSHRPIHSHPRISLRSSGFPKPLGPTYSTYRKSTEAKRAWTIEVHASFPFAA
jgi:hypothetical protein